MIYLNQIELAKQVMKKFTENRVVQVAMPMQSGKTGLIYYLSNFLIQNQSDRKSVGFICGMAYLDLRTQNKEKLEAAYLDRNKQLIASNIKVIDKELFGQSSELNLDEVTNFDYLIIDECDYGSGDKGRLAKMLEQILTTNKDIRILLVSATPYESILSELKVSVIQGKEKDMEAYGYKGLSWFFRKRKVINTKHAEAKIGDTWFQAALTGFKENKYFLVRVKNNSKAKDLAYSISLLNKFDTLIINQETGIKANLDKLKQRPTRPTVVLITNGLTAGVDLGEGKKNIWGVWEIRKYVASCAQGLPGRVCSYGESKDCLIFADSQLLRKSIKFNNDYVECQQLDNIKLSGRVQTDVGGDFYALAKTEVIDRAEFEQRFGEYFYKDEENRYRKKKGEGKHIEFMMTSLSRGKGTAKTAAASRVGTKLSLFDDHYEKGETDRLQMFRRQKEKDINMVEVGIFFNDYTNCKRLGLETTSGQSKKDRKDKFIVLTNNYKTGYTEGSVKSINTMYNNIKEDEDGKLSTTVI